MKHKTVYIVTAGSYSDYRICEVFSTLKLANFYVSQLPESEANVETYVVDDQAGWITRPTYRVDMERSTGNFVSFCTNPLSELAPPNARAGDINTYTYDGKIRICAKSYISVKHAEKLAVEEQQRQLRTKEAK